MDHLLNSGARTRHSQASMTIIRLLKKMSAKKSKRVRPSILSMAKDFVRVCSHCRTSLLTGVFAGCYPQS